MKEKPKERKPQGTPQQKHVLGEIPQGAFDTELSQPLESVSQTPPMKGAGGPQQRKAQTPDETLPVPSPGEDSLELPEGALVAMRRSGGIRFTTREVVVYANGNITVDGSAKSRSAGRAARKLTDSDIAALYRALGEANFKGQPEIPARQNPDAFVYEIAAHVDGVTYSVEASDGSIPSHLAPLLKLLSQYMRA